MLVRLVPLLLLLLPVPTVPPALAGPGDWDCVTVTHRFRGWNTRSFYRCPSGYRPVNVRGPNPGDCVQCGITDRAVTGADVVCFHLLPGGYGCSSGGWIRNTDGRVGILCCR